MSLEDKFNTLKSIWRTDHSLESEFINSDRKWELIDLILRVDEWKNKLQEFNASLLSLLKEWIFIKKSEKFIVDTIDYSLMESGLNIAYLNKERTSLLIKQIEMKDTSAWADQIWLLETKPLIKLWKNIIENLNLKNKYQKERDGFCISIFVTIDPVEKNWLFVPDLKLWAMSKNNKSVFIWNFVYNSVEFNSQEEYDEFCEKWEQ